MKYRHQALMRGVYRIQVGNKFYIGKADQFAIRMKQHERGLFKAWLYSPDLPPEIKMYEPWIKYLLENPKVQRLEAQVIHYCRTETDCSFMEAQILSDLQGNPDCLNKRFAQPSRIPRKDDIWECTKVSRIELMFFDPADPEERMYSCYDPINDCGTINKKEALVRTKKFIDTKEKEKA
ncbi:MAG TPA: hypothetical protein VK616_18360 [Flavitalea sp.]|nr:hypothetical protein [Flavitalea sp.]